MLFDKEVCFFFNIVVMIFEKLYLVIVFKFFGIGFMDIFKFVGDKIYICLRIKY